MDINKKDKFGKTPLYYYYVNDGFHYDKIYPLLLAGAKLDCAEEDFYLPENAVDHVNTIVRVLQFSTTRSHHESDIKLLLRYFLTPLLEYAELDDREWISLHSILCNVYRFKGDPDEIFVDKAVEIFSFLYNLIEDICSDLGIECKLLSEHTGNTFFSECICNHVDVLKFLKSKGVALDVDCCLGASYLDFAVTSGNVESVLFLLSVGARPTKTLFSLLDENSLIDSEIKQLIQTPLSLINICRITLINNPLIVIKYEKLLPPVIVGFIKYEW